LAACSQSSGEPKESCSVGAESCRCSVDGICDPGLVCRSNRCVDEGVSGSGGAGAAPSGAGGAVSTGGAAGAPIKPLTDLERKVVGGWSRSTADYTDHLVFKDDRTACDWTRENGANKGISHFTWSMSGSEIMTTNGISHKYNSTDDQVLQGGYDNLRMFRSGSTTCPE